MRAKLYTYLVGLLISISLYNTANAQLSFPNGDTLNLFTTSNYLYYETRILFHTGSFKSTDYAWDKISDSLDTNWFITACFNGDCKNDLLQNGTFIKDFGLNDTTCFMAFHIQTHDINGTSSIKYRVYNTHNMFDAANLVFNITYHNTTAIKEIVRNAFSINSNFENNTITLLSNSDILSSELRIVNLLGVIQFEKTIDFNAKKSEIDISALPQGIYFIQLQNDQTKAVQKFIKQ
jgi:Secretion system C-terminal sorting domain